MIRWTRTLAYLSGLSLTLSAALAPAVSLAQATPVAPPAAADSTEATPLADAPLSFRLIGEQIIANDATVEGALAGGLSGIDYDAATDAWLIISDDKSESAPARFYTATLTYDDDSFDAVTLDTVVTLLNAAGEPFPAPETEPGIVDPESIRFDAATGGLLWTSEGDRPTAQTPFIASAELDGALIEQWELPEAFAMNPDAETGSRQNLTLEGLTLSPDGDTFWVGMESATYDDGPVATANAGTRTRLMQLDRDGNILAAYAYPLEPLAEAPTGPEGLGDNGLTEILAISDTELLVIERAGISQATGPWKNFIRVYLADISGATDVQDVTSLTGDEVIPVTKELVLDVNTLGLEKVDNIEGITFGPDLPNGNRSLVLISDNNFNVEEQISQVLVFEVLP